MNAARRTLESEATSGTDHTICCIRVTPRQKACRPTAAQVPGWRLEGSIGRGAASVAWAIRIADAYILLCYCWDG